MESQNLTMKLGKTQKLVKRAIKDNLGIEVVDIERAYQVERRKSKSGQTDQDQQRTILRRLRDWKQREQVLRKARREKPTGLYIGEDLSPATLQKREPQIPKLKAAKKAGKIADFVFDRLVEFMNGGTINFNPDRLAQLKLNPLSSNFSNTS